MSLGCRGKQVMRGRGTLRCPGPPLPSSDCSQPRAAGQSRDRWVKRHVEKTQEQRAGGSEAGMQTGPALLPGMRAAALRGQLELDTWEGDRSAVDNTLLYPWARCAALGWEQVAGFTMMARVWERILSGGLPWASRGGCGWTGPWTVGGQS